jgi:hypothetical protein
MWAVVLGACSSGGGGAVPTPASTLETGSSGSTTTEDTTGLPDPPDSGGTPADGPDFRPRVAALRVIDAPPMFSGYLYEGALPWDYEEVARDGDCRALSLGIPVCDPPCAGGEICVGSDQCATYPRLLSAGTLTIDGVPGLTVLEPANPPVYSAGIGALPGPGDVVRVEAAGDALEPFVLETSGVAPLVLDGGIPERAPGEDLVLRWMPDPGFSSGGPTPGSRIRARFAVDHAHRLAPEVVECEGPDDGELIVPASLLDRVMESPDWGCGVCFGQRLERYRGDRANAGAVDVDLEVVSGIGLPSRL